MFQFPTALWTALVMGHAPGGCRALLGWTGEDARLFTNRATMPENRTFFLVTCHCIDFRACASVSSCCERCCRCGLLCSLCSALPGANVRPFLSRTSSTLGNGHLPSGPMQRGKSCST